LIIGTAGHVDHGKTTLIGTLTGENTDRLAEEQERGLSIDLGFSRLDFENGLEAGIIDVPGHEKFIKNMLAGAGGVDIGLLVIAADEAVMDQTREHLSILELLKVEQGVIAVTKSDKVDEEWLELVIDESKDFVQGTFLEDAAVVPVSGIEKTGIDRLKKELSELIRQVPAKDKEANPYFPIDRVFSIAGHGTIVTGTLMQGQIQLEDELEIYPAHLKPRVRGLQVHEEDVEVVQPGQRIGINLAGIDKDEIERGDVLASQDSLVNTEYLDARLELIESAPLVLEHGDRIRLHLGAKEVIGRVYLLDSEELLPGESALVQFRLEETVVANFKEAYVLRRYSPMTTIGGGKILEANPTQHRKNDEAVIKALQIKEEGTLAERIKLALQWEEDQALTVDDLVTRTSLALDTNQYDILLDDLKGEEQIKEEQAKISLKDFAVQLTTREEKIKVAIEEEFEQNKYLPPELDKLISSYSDEQLAEEICNLLINNGELIKVAHNLYFDYQALEGAKDLLKDYLQENETIDLAQFRDLLDSSRKYALPLLEYFDQQGVTVRKGDIRKLGEMR
jgi:selenocysteine-specific elongation factor